MSKILYLIFSLSIFFVSPVTATDIVMVEFVTEEISLKKAESLGLIPELRLEKDDNGHIEFRVERPEIIENRKVHFATIQLFTYEQNITSYIMTKYGSNEKEYVSARINQSIVDSVVVKVFCYDNHIYKFRVELSGL